MSITQSLSRAMRPCDDVVGLIGEAVMRKREADTLEYWLELYTSEDIDTIPYRRRVRRRYGDVLEELGYYVDDYLEYVRANNGSIEHRRRRRMYVREFEEDNPRVWDGNEETMKEALNGIVQAKMKGIPTPEEYSIYPGSGSFSEYCLKCCALY